MERTDYVNNLYSLWVGNNVTQKGLHEMVKHLKPKKQVSEKSPSEIKQEWMRLATFMQGVK